jgi:hypothetical protein
MKISTSLLIVLTGIAPAFLSIRAARTERPERRDSPDSKPLVTLAGAQSRIDKPEYARITSAEEFVKLYMRHLGKDPKQFDEYYNKPGVPTIDFKRCMVVAVFQGNTWNTAAVIVDTITEEKGQPARQVPRPLISNGFRRCQRRRRARHPLRFLRPAAQRQGIDSGGRRKERH